MEGHCHLLTVILDSQPVTPDSDGEHKVNPYRHIQHSNSCSDKSVFCLCIHVLESSFTLNLSPLSGSLWSVNYRVAHQDEDPLFVMAFLHLATRCPQNLSHYWPTPALMTIIAPTTQSFLEGPHRLLTPQSLFPNRVLPDPSLIIRDSLPVLTVRHLRYQSKHLYLSATDVYLDSPQMRVSFYNIQTKEMGSLEDRLLLGYGSYHLTSMLIGSFEKNAVSYISFIEWISTTSMPNRTTWWYRAVSRKWKIYTPFGRTLLGYTCSWTGLAHKGQWYRCPRT